MNIAAVAKLAGVSSSTVSRVINSRPSVKAGTVAAVKRAMSQLQFNPTPRASTPRTLTPIKRGAQIAFLMYGTSGSHPAPAFQRLLFGVSKAIERFSMSLRFSYVSRPDQLPGRVLENGVDGLLLHGARPEQAVEEKLKRFPTVWMMSNRHRPNWGDQVMPDNMAIGEIAARYLVRRGHRRLAYLGVAGWSWAFGLRATAFQQAAADVGLEVKPFTARAMAGNDYWGGDLAQAGRELVDQLLKQERRPTGLFVAEDRLLPVVYSALQDAGLKIGNSTSSDRGDVEIVSCNNERPHLLAGQPQPASIDLRVESIGQRGVEHLMWRMAHPSLPERIRIMIEPNLTEPPVMSPVVPVSLPDLSLTGEGL